VAVIDVFRAFTTAAVALANGASSIVMVRTVEDAWLSARSQASISTARRDQRRDAGHCNGWKPSRAAVPHDTGHHRKGDRSRPSLGLTGSGARAEIPRAVAAAGFD
jgi:hypothetical protein